MSITVQPGGIAHTRIYGLAPDLVGTLWVRITGPATLLAATHDYVTEINDGYDVQAPIPSDAEPGLYVLAASVNGTDWEPDDDLIEVTYEPPTPTGYIPSLAEIGAHLDARTLGGNVRQHTFNEVTTPTGDQVLLFIDDAIGIVKSAVGEFPQSVWPAAKYAIICRVAMAVERSEYAPETDESDGAYQRWLAEYQVALASLSTAISQNQPNQARFGSLPISSVTTQILPAGTGYWS